MIDDSQCDQRKRKEIILKERIFYIYLYIKISAIGLKWKNLTSISFYNTLFFLAKTTSGPLISSYAYLCRGVDQ